MLDYFLNTLISFILEKWNCYRRRICVRQTCLRVVSSERAHCKGSKACCRLRRNNGQSLNSRTFRNRQERGTRSGWHPHGGRTTRGWRELPRYFRDTSSELYSDEWMDDQTTYFSSHPISLIQTRQPSTPSSAVKRRRGESS